MPIEDDRSDLEKIISRCISLLVIEVVDNDTYLSFAFCTFRFWIKGLYWN